MSAAAITLVDQARAIDLISRRDGICRAAVQKIEAGEDSYQLTLSAFLAAERILHAIEHHRDQATAWFDWRPHVAQAEQLWLFHLDTLDRCLEWDCRLPV